MGMNATHAVFSSGSHERLEILLPVRWRAADDLAIMKEWECAPSVDVVIATDWPWFIEVSWAAVKAIVWVGLGPEVVYVAPLGGLARSEARTQTVCE
jgi:hypothetical protein